MDSTVIAEKMARDPLFNPKMMGLRSAEVKELRSSNPALATMSTTGPARSHDPMNHLHKSSTNISSLSQQRSLREHNKHFSASAVALHSNHMFTSSRASSSTAMLHSSYPVQDRSRSLKNLSHFSSSKSLDKDDRAILTWLTGVVGYKITDYSTLYDGVVLCQLINTIKSNTIDVDSYRDKTPAERLQIAFYSIKEHLNINGPQAPIESIIEGKEDDLLFLYLEKIKLFYCTSYGPHITSKMYGSTKSLNRSHSLSAADNKRPMREYRSQTSSPYPPPLYANNSCTNLESIKEQSTSNRKRKPRPHSYHELSTAHLMSSSGARVISVDTGSASEPEDESSTVHGAATVDKSHAQVANSNNKALANNSAPQAPSSHSQLNTVVPKPSSSTALKGTLDQVKVNGVSNDAKLRDSVEGRKHVTPNVTPPRHQLPPLPKAPPPPPPAIASVKRQITKQIDSTDGQSSLQAFLSLSQSRRDLTAAACETCMETQAKVENIIKKERELILYPLQRAFKSEKKRRICLEQKYRKAVAVTRRKIDHYEQCIDELSERVTALSSQVEYQQKLADQRLAELSKQVSSYKEEITYNTSMPPLTTHDICSPTPTDDPVHSKKTFRLFRKTTKKKPSKEKVDGRVLQTTSLKAFPTKDYSEHVDNLNTFLHKLGYSYLIEKFISNDIGLKELAVMDEAHMASIGIPMEPRLRILQEIQTANV